MTGVDDLVFVVAAYGVILGGVTVYAIRLVRRLRRAQRVGAEPRGPAEPNP